MEIGGCVDVGDGAGIVDGDCLQSMGMRREQVTRANIADKVGQCGTELGREPHRMPAASTKDRRGERRPCVKGVCDYSNCRRFHKGHIGKPDDPARRIQARSHPTRKTRPHSVQGILTHAHLGPGRPQIPRKVIVLGDYGNDPPQGDTPSHYCRNRHR